MGLQKFQNSPHLSSNRGNSCSAELSRASPAPGLSRILPRSTAPFVNPQLCDSWKIQASVLVDGKHQREGIFDSCKHSSRGALLLHRRHGYRECMAITRKMVNAPRAILREKVDETTSTETSSRPSNGNEECTLSSSSIGSPGISRELSALDAYFDKLKGSKGGGQEVQTVANTAVLSGSSKDSISDSKVTPIAESSTSTEGIMRDHVPSQSDLSSIEAYFEKLAQGATGKQPSTTTDVTKSKQELEKLVKQAIPGMSEDQIDQMLKDIPADFSFAQWQELLFDGEDALDAEGPSDYSSSESYVVYILAAINIAVYLFGLASPVDSPGMGSCTLPLLYGAKVNELILDGQWWRLITPMFLHSGFLHVALSSWALLFFGPQVENVYGSLAFCMIYFLGGLCGNILSFFNTPAPTVGGTGPFFALLSSWMLYLWVNRKALGESSADYGLKMTTLLGVLIVCLSALLPIDEWIHLGAVVPGAIFGAFACPSVQVAMDANNTRSKDTDSAEGLYATYESPAPLFIALAFTIFAAVCFGAFYLLAPALSDSQMLENALF